MDIKLEKKPWYIRYSMNFMRTIEVLILNDSEESETQNKTKRARRRVVGLKQFIRHSQTHTHKIDIFLLRLLLFQHTGGTAFHLLFL